MDNTNSRTRLLVLRPHRADIRLIAIAFIVFSFAVAGIMSFVQVQASRASAESPFVAKYEILHSFTGNAGYGFNGDTDGANPWAGLTEAPDGNFYGTTANGSATATGPTGTVLKMDPTGKITILHHFLLAVAGDGANPYGALTLAKDGNFYGTTYTSAGVTGGGDGGVIFRINNTGTYTKLFSFTGVEGGLPKAGLIQAKDGYLYGTSTKGGYLQGAVYKMAIGGKPALLHGFKPATDGAAPTCTLVQATDGNLYGTAYIGGAGGFGTVFRLSTGGAFTVIHAFKGGNAQDGANPIGGLIEATDGNLYGTTGLGGQYNLGTIFKIDTSGNYSVIYSFRILDGATPYGNLLEANDGNLYGTTSAGGRNYGTVFRITPSGVFTVLHAFGEITGDGGKSLSTLIQAADGKLYGTTYIGGTQNKGVIFRLDLGLSPSATPTPTPTPSPGQSPTPLSSPSSTPLSSPSPGSSPTPSSSPTPQATPTPGPVCDNNMCGDVRGTGKIADEPAMEDFDIDVNSGNRRGVIHGHFNFSHRPSTVRFRSTSITCLVISEKHATISGAGEFNGAPVTFTVDVDAGSEPEPINFSIVLSNGYRRSGLLRHGRITTHPCRAAHAQGDGSRVSTATTTATSQYHTAVACVPTKHKRTSLLSVVTFRIDNGSKAS